MIRRRAFRERIVKERGSARQSARRKYGWRLNGWIRFQRITADSGEKKRTAITRGEWRLGVGEISTGSSWSYLRWTPGAQMCFSTRYRLQWTPEYFMIIHMEVIQLTKSFRQFKVVAVSLLEVWCISHKLHIKYLEKYHYYYCLYHLGSVEI